MLAFPGAALKAQFGFHVFCVTAPCSLALQHALLADLLGTAAAASLLAVAVHGCQRVLSASQRGWRACAMLLTACEAFASVAALGLLLRAATSHRDPTTELRAALARVHTAVGGGAGQHCCCADSATARWSHATHPRGAFSALVQACSRGAQTGCSDARGRRFATESNC
eukprot:7350550-Prymnesium_polylepis.1